MATTAMKRWTAPGALMALAIAAPAVARDLPYRGEGPLLMKPGELAWSAVGSMPGEARMAVIEGDLTEDEPFTFRLRLPDNY